MHSQTAAGMYIKVSKALIGAVRSSSGHQGDLGVQAGEGIHGRVMQRLGGSSHYSTRLPQGTERERAGSQAVRPLLPLPPFFILSCADPTVFFGALAAAEFVSWL